MPDLILRSAAFEDGEPIPSRFSCDGDNASPPLAWEGVPAGTETLALIVEDPDAVKPNYVHWVVWNIGADITNLREGSSGGGAFVEGTNDAYRRRWKGPCPPDDDGEHRYHFRLYALDTRINLGARASRKDLDRAMAGHVLAEATLTGTYDRTPVTASQE